MGLFDVTELMNRRARAYFELPARFARCRSPFDVWRLQAQFVREGLTDYGRSLNLSREEATHGVVND